MLAPLSWLKEYVSIKEPAEKLAEKLLLSGTKVEKIKKVGKETVFELEITPNRPDTLSMLGLAREVAAITQQNFELPETDLIIQQKIATQKVPFVVKNKKLCPHYSVVKLSNISIGSSPEWVRDLLNLAGVRSLNNVVDITNFVMLETGQPMHAFDARKIKGNLTLRPAKPKEAVTTLDNITRVLPEGAIVIEDEEKLVDLAGLMGGQNSEIDKKTTEVILLVPVYDPTTIRKTSIYTNLRTEASNRFEKKLDPNQHIFTINRAIKLFSELSGAIQTSKIESTKPVPEKVLFLKKALVSQLIGREFSDAEVFNLLSPAGFSIKNSDIRDGSFEVQIPSYRTDIDIPEDLVEEITRFYGYNKLPKTIPASSPPLKPELSLPDNEAKIRNFLLRNGFSESTGYTLISKTDCLNFGSSEQEVLKVRNPASSDFEYLRPTLLINAVKAVAANPGVESLNFFEIAKVFEKEIDKITNLPKQPVKLGLVSTNGLLEFKGILGELFSQFNLEFSEKKGDTKQIFSDSSSLYLGKEQVGFFGKISDSVLKNYGITNKKVWAAEINFSIFPTQVQQNYKSLPKYPSIKEDISFYLSDKYQIGTVISQLKLLDKLIYKIELLDIFEDKQKRSVTLGFEFLGLDKTLTNTDAEKIRNKIIKLLKTGFGSIVREG